MISKEYFLIPKLTFRAIGIDLTVKNSKDFVKQPILLYGLILLSCFHFIIAIHYASKHILDFVEITDSLPMICQLILTIWKMIIFLYKKQDILSLIKEMHEINLKSKFGEMSIVVRENSKDYFLCSLYLRIVKFSGSFALLHPIVYALFVYVQSGKLVLNEPNKATYFWYHTHWSGYMLVYVLNAFTVYYVCVVSLAIDTLFSWFVTNIIAQFHIICYRFECLALKCIENTTNSLQLELNFKSCLQYHHEILQLSEKLNQVYGEIIFIKFIIVCTEICSLVFRVERPNDSVADVVYKCLFLSAVAVQLVLYCYNGQRIRDKSYQVTTEIYFAFDWSTLCKSYKQLLLISMMRSQRCSHIRGVFFEVDLSLYLWVFKTACSLITALKTLDDNKG